MQRVIFGPDHLSPCEIKHLQKVKEKLSVDENTLIVEATRQFIRKIKA